MGARSLNIARGCVVFVSTIVGVPWGGSEELWSQTAVALRALGWRVGASVQNWLPPHKRIIALAEAGVVVQNRASQHSLGRRLFAKVVPDRRSLIALELERFINSMSPSLVVFSDGGAFHPIELLELCISKKMPFITLSHVNHEDIWPEDQLAARYRNATSQALRCYFVSNANRELFEKQIGCQLRNAEIIRNPFNVDINSAPRWPTVGQESELRIAAVGRLHPPSKGQHILLEALADPAWRNRSWSLCIYGDGPARDGIERLVDRFELGQRVKLLGHVESVEKIWAENHVLVMPSRYEGLPLAVVEAMLCARPVLATDVAGHSEVIDDGVTGFLADAPTVISMRRALDRLWEGRAGLQAMGEAAARRIRTLVPADPVQIFAEKIKRYADVNPSAGTRLQAADRKASSGTNVQFR